MRHVLPLLLFVVGMAISPTYSGAQRIQTLSGTLLDAECKSDDASNKCAVTSTSGQFGIELVDGKFLKFDAKGNASIRVALQRRRAKSGDINRAGSIRISVSGSTNGDMLTVDAVELY
jgi:hypothetical protein